MDLTEEALEALMERAARRGADEALRAVGLHDEHAAKDVAELRGLLDAWRGTKSAAWQTVVKWVTTITLAAISAGVAVKAGVIKLGGTP